MIVGIGCDVVDLPRFAKVLSRAGNRFLLRLFTPAEVIYCERFSNPIPHFAGKFAAKEALSKALGVGIGRELSWHDMEILNADHGRPHVVWHINVQQLFSVDRSFISISHSDSVAIAQAVLEGHRPTLV